MKCSACKNKNADSYKKIVPGHELFETLQKMNYNQPYPTNSYFCGECLLIAAENLKQMQLLAQSNTVSAVNITETSSQSSNARNNIVPVPTKSSSNKENKPQPKRIKLSDQRPGPASRKRKIATSSVTETTSSQDYTTGLASRKRKSATPNVAEKTSSQESSQSVAQNLLFLNVQSSTQSSQESVSARLRRSRRQPQDVPNVETSEGEKSKRESDSSSVLPDDKQSRRRRQSVEFPNTSTTSGTANERETSNRESDSSSALADAEQQPIVGPSAPAPKNPRIRQERSQMEDAMRRFFQQGAQGPGINVNNYSRNLAG